MRRFFQDNGLTTIDILHNNCHFYGTGPSAHRGWFYEEEQSGHNEKVFNREVIRLEASLKGATLDRVFSTPATAARRSSPSWRRTA